MAYLSANHLAHVFQQQDGTSVYAYVLRTRLAATLERVLEAHEDLDAIGLDAGFASHSHFTARFRALFGLTPSALRSRRNTRQARASELRRIVTAR